MIGLKLTVCGCGIGGSRGLNRTMIGLKRCSILFTTFPQCGLNRTMIGLKQINGWCVCTCQVWFESNYDRIEIDKSLCIPMRILLSLKSLQDYQVNFEYHHKVQGLIYSLLRNTKYDQLHDKRGFKFFCFSNIYRPKDSNTYNLIISSPDPIFLTQIEYQLNKVIENQIPIEMGSLFELVKIVKIPQKNLDFPIHLITQSPIVIRIPIEKYQDKITNTAPYKSLLWRSGHPVELFVEALEANLKKKYNEFTGNELKSRIFEGFSFQKQVSTKIDVGRSKVPIIGSLWKLSFSSEIPYEFQLFAMDCGIGERNSIGFGFVNPIFQKKH